MREMLDLEDFLFRFDTASSSMHLKDIDHILELFADHFLILSIKVELDQLVDGLNVLNMLKIRSNPKKLFVYEEPKRY